MRNKEYDAFGPWILEIKERDEIPALFRDYISEDKERPFAIKVPREIERRKAKPGMDLYDCVMILYEEYFYILKRDGKKVKTKEVRYEDIYAIKNKRDLLYGLLSIYLSNEIITITYNTVSDTLIEKTIDLLKAKYLSPNESKIKNIIPEKEINITLPLFRNLLYQLKQNEKQVDILAFQPSMYFKRVKSFFNRINIYSKLALQSSLYLTNGKELIVLSKGKQIKKAKQVDYSYEYAYIPIDKIEEIKFRGHEEFDDLRNIVIHTGSQSFTYSIDWSKHMDAISNLKVS